MPEKSEIMKAAKILEVEGESDLNAIKKRFRKLAVEWHPDKSKHKNAANKFKKFNEAFHMIQDYCKHGGQLPISTYCKEIRTRRRVYRGQPPQPPEVSDIPPEIFGYTDDQGGSFWMFSASGPVDPNTFWNTLNNMFNPNLMNGMGNVIGGAQQVMGDWLGPKVNAVGDNFRKATDFIGVTGKKKELDLGKLDDLMGIVAGEDAEVRDYLKGFRNLSDGWKAVTKGVSALSNEGKTKPKKKQKEKKEIKVGRGSFVVAPNSLGRYKDLSNEGVREYPLFGNLMEMDGNSNWGTYHVRLKTPDIAIIGGREYTLICKQP